MSFEEKTLRTVPVVAVRGSVVFPHTDSLLSFGRSKSISAVNTAFQEDRVIAVFSQRNPESEDPEFSDLYKVGTIATITQMMTVDGEIHAMIKGQARVRIVEELANEPHMVAKVEEIAEEDLDTDESQALGRQLTELFRRAVNLGKNVEIPVVMRIISGQSETVEIADSIAALLDIRTKEKLSLLNTFSVKERLQKVIDLLAREVNILDLERTITMKTQKKFEDQMKKAMLREKKKTIQRELGELGEEDETSEDEVKEYEVKIKKAGMSKIAEEKAKKELKRFAQMNPNNPENAYIRNYLDWLTDMPWSVATSNDISISKASKILDGDHFGLEKVKQRILEYLAVMKLKKDTKKSKEASQPTILCFMGPPGVGKTSIGKSIAKSLGREFVRVSLGGLRDEAEIRGHRRTYVGALPGRIIQGMKTAGTKNPVFMLDEIDKLGVDFRGDPSSALLEALDPEQNKEFSDHYLEVPFDLSEVMFIATGNVLDTIPAPLRDRMEIITFAGYIDSEKLNIAKKYLWPKQVKLHGLDGKKIEITEEALKEVVSGYTREAGVRDLERNMASLCRKIAKLVAEKKKYPTKIGLADIRKLLGAQRFTSLIAEKEDEVGMATGMYVTSVGGGILFVEVALMPGRGKLVLTGQLGDVMKESAMAAFTWAKSHWATLGLKRDFGSKVDIHIHVPEGAVPKDGPSAGVAITTSVVSVLTGLSVKRDVSMTGEVTLRGRVLEIGGVKEKVTAAHRAGIRTIILPKDNKKDLEEVPEYVKKDIKFVFASEVEDVLRVAINNWPPKRNQKDNASHQSLIAQA